MKRIAYYKTLWGVDINLTSAKSIEDKLLLFKSSGFEGVEVATGFFPKEKKALFLECLRSLQMGIITQIHTTGYPVTSFDVNEHFDDFKLKIEDSMSWNPKLINSHTGKDDFTLEEQFRLFTKISEFELKVPEILICHETHRQRSMFTPQLSNLYMKNFLKLNFTADISHWVLVNERLCDETTDREWLKIINQLSKKTGLIHARISSPQQIQVIDPFSADNKDNLEYFTKIWKQIVSESERPVIYIDPEFGPHPYQIIDGCTGKPFKENEKIINDTLTYLKRTLI